MCYLTDGAQDHINKIDSQVKEFDHECIACGEGFDKGFGVKILDEKFCDDCFNNENHLEYYKSQVGNQYDDLIDEFTNNITDI